MQNHNWVQNRMRPFLFHVLKAIPISFNISSALFNLCGHGYFNMSAHEAYFVGKLTNRCLTEEELMGNLKGLEKPSINL